MVMKKLWEWIDEVLFASLAEIPEPETNLEFLLCITGKDNNESRRHFFWFLCIEEGENA